MTVKPPVWPRTTGVSLLLVPVDHREEDWARAEEVVRTSIEHMGIAVARGLSHSDPYVSAGAESLLRGTGRMSS